MITTRLTTALGIAIPVIQGGMQHVGLPPLCAAVSNAGGLGIISGLTAGSPEGLRKAIRETRALTTKPFGINLTFLPSITPPPYGEFAQVIIDEKVKIVETAGGPAAGPVIKQLAAAGIYVIHKCTSIRHAKTAVKMGASCLSIDGFECAGHPGENDIGGLILLALAAKALDVPFVASGGIADGRGMAAALALGACGVNLGTRFMATEESHIHQNIKNAMVQASELDTVHIFRSLNNTARVFKNKVAMEVVALEKKGAEFKDLAHLVSGARGRGVYDYGDPDYGIWSASPVMGLIDDIPTCAVLLSTMERECEEIMLANASMVTRSSKL